MAFIPFPVALPQGVQGGLWKIEEDESFFRQALFLFPEEEAYLSQFRDAEKRKEWLASRLIIRIILKPDSPLLSLTMEDGSPFISGWQGCVSISHTQGWAAVILSDTQKPGIDLEWSDRILTFPILNRFLHAEEKSIVSSQDVEKSGKLAVLAWSAKETLFKLVGRKGISFREDLFVNLPLTWENDVPSNMESHIQTHETKYPIQVHYVFWKGLVCTWAVVPFDTFGV